MKDFRDSKDLIFIILGVLILIALGVVGKNLELDPNSSSKEQSAQTEQIAQNSNNKMSDDTEYHVYDEDLKEEYPEKEQTDSKQNSQNKDASGPAKNKAAEDKTEETTDNISNELGNIVSDDIHYDGLDVGETAQLGSYDITVNAVGYKDGYLIANVTMSNLQYGSATFATRYLDALSGEAEISATRSSNRDDVDLSDGESYTATIAYYDPNHHIDGLRWDNWSNEAEWYFSPSEVEQGQIGTALETGKSNEVY